VGVRTQTSGACTEDATVEFLAVFRPATNVNRLPTRAKILTIRCVKITANACRQTIFCTAIARTGISDLGAIIKVSLFFVFLYAISGHI